MMVVIIDQGRVFSYNPVGSLEAALEQHTMKPLFQRAAKYLGGGHGSTLEVNQPNKPWNRFHELPAESHISDLWLIGQPDQDVVHLEGTLDPAAGDRMPAEKAPFLIQQLAAKKVSLTLRAQGVHWEVLQELAPISIRFYSTAIYFERTYNDKYLFTYLDKLGHRSEPQTYGDMEAVLVEHFLSDFDRVGDPGDMDALLSMTTMKIPDYSPIDVSGEALAEMGFEAYVPEEHRPS